MTTHIPHWVDRARWDGTSGRSALVTNPASGAVSGRVALASGADCDTAIGSASAAFPRWRDTSLAKRVQILFAFRELLNSRKQELAAIITGEHGKVLSDALGVVTRGQEVVEFACGIPHLLKGGFTANASTRVDVQSIRQPVGPVVVDGRDVSPDADGDGFWLGPTLLDHVGPSMSIYTDEIFGPVLSVVRADTYADAIDLANRNPYGNGVAIFTNDRGAARRFQNEVEVGMVGVNVPIPVPMAYYSFGGWKSSLFGDAHAHGTEGVHFFTRGKVVTTRWLDPSHAGVDLGFSQNR